MGYSLVDSYRRGKTVTDLAVGHKLVLDDNQRRLALITSLSWLSLANARLKALML